MLTLQIKGEFPIQSGCCDKYRGIANDKLNFYFTIPEVCEIHKYDLCLENKEVIKTCRGYGSICYDDGNKCFWAISSNMSNKIFKLDLLLKETEYITIKDEKMSYISLTSLSCICDSDKLLVTFNGKIGEVDKINGATIRVIQKGSINRFSSAQALNEYYVASKKQGSNSILSIYSYNEKLKMQCCIPEEYDIDDMTHICYQCGGAEIDPTFHILATKRGKGPYLLKCNIEYSSENACGCVEESPCEPFIRRTKRYGKKPNCKKNICDIIESIALIEVALSHILNAEGEKIEKTITIAKDTCQLIKVNDSVNKTIVNITHLEQILFSKLQLALQMYNEMYPKSENNVCDMESNVCDTSIEEVEKQ